MAGFMGLSGDVDLMTLQKLAEEIENDFLNSGIVSQLTITGFPDLEISVEITEENLLRYNLTFSEIANAIAQNNIDLSGGMIKSDEEEILIRSRSRSVDPAKISDIILRANPNGSFLHIRDVATVKVQFADVPGESFMNGKQSVSFQVNKLPNEDLSTISEYINNYVSEFNAKHDAVKLDITYDFLEMLKQRLLLLRDNGGIGLILVILALGLFLNFRLSLWVAWGIPASFFAMFMVANIYGITINMISLFGMILVIGILVDDGIVIAENIFAHFEAGKSPRRAAIDGAMEVIPAVVTSVSTTIVAFSPLFMLGSMMEFMFEMAFVVVFSLFFSLFEAFFVLPAHLASPHVLRHERRSGRGMKIRRNLDKGINYVKEKIYGFLLIRIIKFRWAMVFLPLGLFTITAGLFQGGFIQYTFFPSIPFDQFNIDVAFKPGTGEKITFEYVKKFDDAIWEVNKELKEELSDTVDFVNYTYMSVGMAFNGQETGSHAGNIFVLLRDLEDSGTSSFEIVNRVSEKIGETPQAEKFSVAGRNTFGDPISISLLGENFAELNQAKGFLENEMRLMPTLTNITDNNAVGKQEVRLKLKPKAYFLGLNQISISNQVRQGFYGDQAQRLQDGRNELRVWVRYPKQDRLNIGQLEKMKIKTPAGNFPLSELAEYTIERGPVSIKRYNGQREIRVTAGVIDPLEPVPPLLGKIKTEIIPVLLEKFPSVRVDYLGQQKETNEAMGDLQKYFGIALLIIILIITVHFKSVSHALIIILMIPMGWLGAIWGHGFEGIPVSMLSTWGMVALSGVIINDAVVFLQKYNNLLLEGKKVLIAAQLAGKARFRAILLTTITTTVGLYPIILEKSFQAQFLRPMAVSLAYGVMIGTIFILLFFPALIVGINDVKVLIRWIRTGKKPSKESVTKAIIHKNVTVD
jgi:multidrug efflux pump subunit AcrB